MLVFIPMGPVLSTAWSVHLERFQVCRKRQLTRNWLILSVDLFFYSRSHCQCSWWHDFTSQFCPHNVLWYQTCVFINIALTGLILLHWIMITSMRIMHCLFSKHKHFPLHVCRRKRCLILQSLSSGNLHLTLWSIWVHTLCTRNVHWRCHVREVRQMSSWLFFCMLNSFVKWFTWSEGPDVLDMLEHYPFGVSLIFTMVF